MLSLPLTRVLILPLSLTGCVIGLLSLALKATALRQLVWFKHLFPGPIKLSKSVRHPLWLAPNGPKCPELVLLTSPAPFLSLQQLPAGGGMSHFVKNKNTTIFPLMALFMIIAGWH